MCGDILYGASFIRPPFFRLKKLYNFWSAYRREVVIGLKKSNYCLRPRVSHPGVLFVADRFLYVCACWQVLAKHATLEDAVDEICAAMSKKKEDPVRVRVRERRGVRRLPAVFVATTEWNRVMLSCNTWSSFVHTTF